MKTVHNPTAVDDCCSCRFFSNNEENLVVAVSNWLKVYRVFTEETKNAGKLYPYTTAVPNITYPVCIYDRHRMYIYLHSSDLNKMQRSI